MRKVGLLPTRDCEAGYDPGYWWRGFENGDVKLMFFTQKVRWVNIYNITDSNWKILFDEVLSSYGGNVIFHCNINPKQVGKWNHISYFCKDMLKAYFDLVDNESLEKLLYRTYIP